LAVARGEEIEHLGIAVAGLEPLAHQQSQVAGERRVGIVDRLVLAHHAAQLARKRACTSFQLRIAEDFIRLHRECLRRTAKHDRAKND
jgi:hypothetical protein